MRGEGEEALRWVCEGVRGEGGMEYSPESDATLCVQSGGLYARAGV